MITAAFCFLLSGMSHLPDNGSSAQINNINTIAVVDADQTGLHTLMISFWPSAQSAQRIMIGGESVRFAGFEAERQIVASPFPPASAAPTL
jgi:hypothetical protein